jgi:hypothetical protein
MALPPITGTANIMESGDLVSPPSPPQTYLGMARAFISGAWVLDGAQGSSISLAFVAAQATECGLKAYLSRSGDDARLKSHPLRHDLGALWLLAAQEGLDVVATPPPWLLNLSHLHGSPYYLRYSTGVHGLVLPAADPMVAEISALIEQISKQL